MGRKLKLKTLTQIGSDIYHEGTYDEAYLPFVIRNDPSLVSEVGKPEGEVTEFKSSLKTQKIEIGSAQSNEKTSFKTKPPVVIEDPKTKEEDKENTEPPIYDPNQATIEELESVDGITVNTAQKVIEERVKKKFVDFADLDKRVPLKGNRKWEIFGDRLSINS